MYVGSWCVRDVPRIDAVDRCNIDIYGSGHGDRIPCAYRRWGCIVKQSFAALIVGLVFGVGLVLSGMTSPDKVVGFLDVFGEWDPSLAFVMGGAVLTYAPIRLWVLQRDKPVLDTSFEEPVGGKIDAPLLVGAAVFGVGWGLVGFCPGPAIVSVGTAVQPVLLFVACMGGGMALHKVMVGAESK